MNLLDFQALFEASPNPYALLTPALSIAAANDAYAAATLARRETMAGRKLADVFPESASPEGHARMIASLARVRQEQRADHLAFVRHDIPASGDLNGDYEERYWSVTHIPLLGSNSELRYILQTAVDVTELHRLQSFRSPEPDGELAIEMEWLQQARSVEIANNVLNGELQQLRDMFDQAPGFTAMLTGPDHVFVFANLAYFELVGRRSIIGKSVREALPELEGQDIFECLDEVWKSGRPFRGRREKLVVVGQAPRYVDCVYQPIRDRDGEVSGIFVQGSNVTAEVLAEGELREREQLYRNTIELSGQIPWIAGSQGDVIWFGSSWCDLTGRSREDSVGWEWATSLHPADAYQALAAWRKSITEGVPFKTEVRIRTRTGTFERHQIRAASRAGDEGTTIAWYGTMENVEEQRHAEDRLKQLQSDLIHVSRVSAMGTLASSIAHELNQPLSAITNYVRGSRRYLENPSPEALAAAVDAMEETDRSAMRAGEIVRSLREMISRGELRHTRGDLTALISEACRIALIDARYLGIDSQVILPGEPAPAIVDGVQIQQVMLNLIRNAVEAVEGAPEKRIAIALGKTPTGTYEVSIADSGAGVQPEFLEHMFTPFKTTKKKGMGVGLSICRTIIEAHGGHIWYESETPDGHAFKFTLPVEGGRGFAT